MKFRHIPTSLLFFVFLVFCALNGLLQVTFLSKLWRCSSDDKSCELYLKEVRITSYENYAVCKIPDLPIDNPEIMAFYNIPDDDKPLVCNKTEDWIECDKSFCSIKESIKLEQGQITCIYTDIFRKSDFKLKTGQTTSTNGSYTLKGSDFIKVLCSSSNGGSWFGVGIGIRRRSIKKIKSNTNKKLYNVLIFGFDSLSRNAFMRSLPKTYEYLTETLNGHVLKGYNIVGDGSQNALIPILTGHNELELPETRKRIPGSTNVDLYPLIWKDYQKNGYVTSFNEDYQEYGTFQYRLNGFKRQPTDHYMRILYLLVENLDQKYCIGSKMGHLVMMNYMKNIMLYYENIAPFFAFNFHAALSHDSINLIHNADKDVHQWLVNLNDNNLLENTILILMSDHGNRFTDVRNTIQGKQEERLPFFSFTFPKSFKRKYPNEFNNFENNLNILTTPFDIHETLLDLLRLQNLTFLRKFNKYQNMKPARGISLFQQIPKDRSCSMAYIEPHWCSCLKWNYINNTNDELVQNLAKNVINTINNYTSYFRNICETLKLVKINWAMSLAPNEHLIRFKKYDDTDRFIADMTSRMEIELHMYQIQITVEPGNSIFESSVGHNRNNNSFIVQMSQISRINRYGSQANCIYNLYPDLRNYCYCK